MFNRNEKKTDEPAEKPCEQATEVMRLPKGSYILGVEIAPGRVENTLIVNSEIVITPIPGNGGMIVNLGAEPADQKSKEGE